VILQEFIIDNQIEIVTAEIEDALATRSYPIALSILKSSWPFFRNQINKKRAILVGEVLIRNGYCKAASGFLEHLVLLHPRDPEVLRWWVQAYAELLKVKDIIPRAEIAVTNPNVHVVAVEHLCDSLIKNGQFSRAEELLRRNGKRLQTRGHRLMMHLLFYQYQRHEENIKYLNRIPGVFSQRSEFVAHKALSYLEVGMIEKGHDALADLVADGCMNAAFTKYELHRAEEQRRAAFDTLNDMFSFHGMSEFAPSWMDNGFELDKIEVSPSPVSEDERLVSVIMTAHKVNPMMDTAVNSILNQTHKNLELLIIDDASQPEDVAAYQQYESQDSRVRVVRQEMNAGTYAGRNRGISEAKGDFISFIDSDDWQHPQKLEHALARLDKAEDSVATLESYIRLYPNGRLAKVGSWFARKALMCITWKTSVLKDELGGFDEVRVSADSELLERAEIRYGKSALVHTPAPTYIATYHDSSLTGGGQFAIGWPGIRGPRAAYVSSFRSWHAKLRASPTGLAMVRQGAQGLFLTPEEMPRSNAGYEYTEFIDSEMTPILEDMRKFNLNMVDYKVSERRDVKEEISVCMATFPARFSVIGKAVQSLLDQRLPPTRILIHVNESDIPPPLPDDDRIEVYCSPDENLTDIGKFKMTEKVNQGYVLTVDEDIIYPEDYIESHIHWLQRFDNQVITGFHGAVLPVNEPIQTWQDYKDHRRVHWFRRGLSTPLPVQIVGTGTMAYHVDTVQFDYRDFQYQRMVDLFIAAHAQCNNIPMITPPRPDEWMVPIEEEDEELEAIWAQVQVDFDLQNKMLEVIQSAGKWKLITPNQIIHHEMIEEPLKLSFERLPSNAQTHIPYNVAKRWRQNGNTLHFAYDEIEVYFKMPDDWRIEETHEDLLRVAHYVMTSPWEDGILDDWIPSRKPGWRPGLAFSGGVDSVAAMLLMPQDTALVYNRREGFSSGIDHTNADRLFSHMLEKLGRPVLQVPSSHESIRKFQGKTAGFSTDYACAVQVILLADYLQLDSLATGMPLENTYLFHGHRYRNFGASWFWRHYSEIFRNIGLSIYQPVGGCSEVINQKIVTENNLLDFAQSCLRSNKPGKPCGACWKCFRKNTLAGHEFSFSNEIDTFLKKRPLKQAASTLYSIQKLTDVASYQEILSRSEDLNTLVEGDYSFLEAHHEGGLKLLPEKYRRYTSNRLSQYSRSMTPEQFEVLATMDLFPQTQ
jgi:hypothetical protein